MSARYDVIVVGSGMTGLTASRELAQQALAVANIEGGVFGGLITNVNELEGEYHGSGADLASTLMMEVTELGCAMLSETVTGLRRQGTDLAVATDSAEHAARCVIVASGAKLKRLGVPGEAELEYKGVSQCADCDGPLFRGEDVVVVGGGDSALQEALVLASCCANVRIVHHAAQLSAHSGRQEAIRSCGNISVLPMSEVTAIEGAGVVKAVRVRSLTDGSVRALPCGGVFVYVGLSPSTGFLPREVARDASGAAQANDALETSLANVFVAGAARAGFGGTLSDAVRDGRTVAAAVFQRLRGA